MLITICASVDTPVTIPFKYPVERRSCSSTRYDHIIQCDCNTRPTIAPALNKLSVVIPIVWSARSSITQTFNPFAHDPGVFAAQENVVSEV